MPRGHYQHARRARSRASQPVSVLNKLTATHRTAHIAVLVATFLASTSFPIAKHVTSYMPAALLVFLRFASGVLIMLPLFRKGHLSIPSGSQVPRLGLLGLLYGGFFVLMFVALAHTSALNAAVIYTLVPSITAVAGALVLKERLRPTHYALLPIGILATAWVVTRGRPLSLTSISPNLGDPIFLVACVFLAFYATFIKKFATRLGPPANLVFWPMLTGAALALTVSVPVFGDLRWSEVPINVYLWIIGLGIMTVGTATVWTRAGVKIGPTRTLAYTYLTPTFVLLIVWVLQKRAPPLIVLPGVLVGVLVMIALQLQREPDAPGP